MLWVRSPESGVSLYGGVHVVQNVPCSVFAMEKNTSTERWCRIQVAEIKSEFKPCRVILTQLGMKQQESESRHFFPCVEGDQFSILRNLAREPLASMKYIFCFVLF